jgi:hypothetical protein
MSASSSRIIARLRRRLEAMELEHLRAHALDLHQRLEKAEDALHNAERCADFWQDQASTMQEAAADPAFATHRSIGLNKDGELLVVRVSA